MSQLIQMRQRIKAIETIKKIAHAMRLISMSAHLQLKSKEQAVATYTQATTDLFSRIHTATPAWQNPFINESPNNPQHLYIVIGSQKGLCGTFNDVLFKFMEIHPFAPNHHIITVGKRVTDYFTKHDPQAVIAHHDQLSLKNSEAITQLIVEKIIWAQQPFSSITIISNRPISFFVQKPSIVNVLPYKGTTENSLDQEYESEQNINDILTALAKQYLQATIYTALFQSLLAEHSARFISMDSSTRNARDLLAITELEYNKARQAKITKELAELISSFTS